jgi:hypothetical protein
MTTPDVFALGGRQENPDAEILSLFHEWLDAYDARDALGDDDETEDEADAAVKHITDLEDAIIATRGGPAGLAIKTFLNCRLEAARRTPKQAQIRLDRDTDTDTEWLASLLRDAADLVPEIAELAAAVIHDDAELIDAEMEREWVIKVRPAGNYADEWKRSALARGHKALDRIARTPAKTPRGEGIKLRYRNVALCSMPDGSIGRFSQRSNP